ncbi:MAG TPA: UDP-N-acetylmuramoyl-tripeptide--D-alanyl-D-alanine ligase [Acidimicrobiales bacterium]|nr:UDP-N-acetylmuramoyl-tripeptide--D-alanyl-D-alanine ligase [Acidimicrobiales bacterium]
MRFTAGAIAAATGGALVGEDVEVDGAAFDSREVRPGQLFVPLVDARDGHDFIAAALEAGAVAYLTARQPTGGTAVVVEDTAGALMALGAAARDRLPDRVVGVTGSVGKTTVKDALRAVLAERFVTAANERSFNNEIGVPITLVNAPPGAEAVVVEMGARGLGHIARLCEVARPTIGVVTAVGMVHTELFGSVDDVARGKAELVEALPADGTAVLNADDERVAAMRDRTPAAVVTYGVEQPADVRATEVALDGELRPAFTLHSPWGTAAVRLSMQGVHQVGNALAAAAAGLAAGASLDDVAAGLGSATPSPWRMEVGRARSGALVINDAYNANPLSVAAALRSLAAVDAGRRIAFLGHMAELGPSAADAHREAAALARSLGIRVVAVAEPMYGVEGVEDAAAAFRLAGTLQLGAGDAVLVKGSRVAGLEALAAALLA